MNMKTGMKNLKRIALIVLAGFLLTPGFGQQPYEIKGIVICETTNEPLPFATIVILNAMDSSVVSGTMSNYDGEFSQSIQLSESKYFLRASFVGYESVELAVQVTGAGISDLGRIILRESSVQLVEFVVYGERIRARVEHGKTTFYMNQMIYNASATGADVLKFIPGVQIDLMQNLSLEGNRNVLIMVDGKERDLSFIRQLNPKNIDNIEIINSPGAEYDSQAGGVIHVRLKERETGLSSRVYAELPSTKSEVYIFPNYSFLYGTGKFNFFTSYNGEVSNFDILETGSRSITGLSNQSTLDFSKEIRQNNWSHRFNYGVDYYLNERNQLNFYGYFNPFSREHDGMVFLGLQENEEETLWSAQKEDTNINHKLFSSLFYRHIFAKDHEITFDLSHYSLNSENTTEYSVVNQSDVLPESITNTVMPRQKNLFMRADYKNRINEEWGVSFGTRATLRDMTDRNNTDFHFRENVFASYGRVDFTKKNVNMNFGLRAEITDASLQNSFTKNNFHLLPSASISLQLKGNQNIRLSYNRSVSRLNLYQLNPAEINDDPYSTLKGNPFLQPELRDFAFIDYSRRISNNFFSTRVFFQRSQDAVSYLTFINEWNVFETQIHNLGDITSYGMQFSGAFRIAKFISFNPFVKVSHMTTRPNELARNHRVQVRKELALESGLSAIVFLQPDLTVSLAGQYGTPQYSIQESTFSDVLYFVSAEKNFNNRITLGISSGLPFKRSFVYHGNKASGHDFKSRSAGSIQMSLMPVWFKFSYNFSSGKKLETIQREREQIESLPRKGF